MIKPLFAFLICIVSCARPVNAAAALVISEFIPCFIRMRWVIRIGSRLPEVETHGTSRVETVVDSAEDLSSRFYRLVTPQ